MRGINFTPSYNFMPDLKRALDDAGMTGVDPSGVNTSLPLSYRTSNTKGHELGLTFQGGAGNEHQLSFGVNSARLSATPDVMRTLRKNGLSDEMLMAYGISPADAKQASNAYLNLFGHINEVNLNYEVTKHQPLAENWSLQTSLGAGINLFYAELDGVLNEGFAGAAGSVNATFGIGIENKTSRTNGGSNAFKTAITCSGTLKADDFGVLAAPRDFCEAKVGWSLKF